MGRALPLPREQPRYVRAVHQTARHIHRRFDHGELVARAPGFLHRFRADVVALRPKIVHILAGTNDVAGDTGATAPQDYKNNIMTMVDIARVNGIAVILGTIPPAAGFPWRPQLKPAPVISMLNATRAKPPGTAPIAAFQGAQ